MMAAYVNNGTVETIEFLSAPGVFVIVQGNTTAPPFLVIGVDIVQPSIQNRLS